MAKSIDRQIALLIKKISERVGIRSYDGLEELFPADIIAKKTGKGHVVYDLDSADRNDQYVKGAIPIIKNGMNIGVISAWDCWRDHKDDFLMYMHNNSYSNGPFTKEDIEEFRRIIAQIS